LAFSKGEDIDAVPTEKERIEYEKVNSFNFAVLLCECDELKILTERIKLITARLYEFEQWKIEHEKIDDVSGSYVTDYHKLLYPNFEKLCKVEIEKLEKLIKLESDLPTELSSDKILSESTDKLTNSDYIWKSSATDLLELAAALYQNKSIERRDGKDMTRKELIEYFQALFNIEINDIEGKLSKASGRTIRLFWIIFRSNSETMWRVKKQKW
jgi:hypothetical protein